MDAIIVVPAWCMRPEEQIRLAPGETLHFGRAQHAGAGDPAVRRLVIGDEAVSRTAGYVTASASFWALSNLSRHHTYVVENPEGAGEHIKVAPGRVEAPVPFEFSRVVLPAREGAATFDVWTPRHLYRSGTHYSDDESHAGQTTAHAFSLDHSKRYFLVLTALCEPRLRGATWAPLPTSTQLIDRLRTSWPGVNRASVQWNIDYLAVKLGLKPAREESVCGERLHGKKERLAVLALRFDLVSESDLNLLDTAATPASPTTPAAHPAPLR